MIVRLTASDSYVIGRFSCSHADLGTRSISLEGGQCLLGQLVGDEPAFEEHATRVASGGGEGGGPQLFPYE